MPLAPGLFSDTTGCLSLSRRPSATMRPERSVMPAGGNGISSRIGRDGYGSAAKAVAEPMAPIRNARKARIPHSDVSFARRSILRPELQAHALVHELQAIGLLVIDVRLDHAGGGH